VPKQTILIAQPIPYTADVECRNSFMMNGMINGATKKGYWKAIFNNKTGSAELVKPDRVVTE